MTHCGIIFTALVDLDCYADFKVQYRPVFVHILFPKPQLFQNLPHFQLKYNMGGTSTSLRDKELLTGGHKLTFALLRTKLKSKSIYLYLPRIYINYR